MSAIEPTIAHELTHYLLQHLPIPAWLNEGIAVNTEHRLSPPGRPLYTPDEMHEKHLAFWDETTIQEFWSGKSWRRPDEGNSLSYDLAVHFVAMSSRDFAAFLASQTLQTGLTAEMRPRAHILVTQSRLSQRQY